MNAERWRKVRELFDGAVAVAPGDVSPFLRRACAGDAELRAEVESLLAAHRKAGDFIEAPAVDDALSIVRAGPDGFEAGARVGRYKLISEIGRGGMGAVYLAERADDEYKKRVALKLIKRGMDTDAVLARFRAERQILAQLEHPNIARLLDGGTTDDSSPFIVMEYVEGAPITKYADANQLSVNERLKLFRSVCAAVSYAHRNLIIHRDIKPSNILVNKEGTPKLLDFGIAKLLDADGRNETETATALRAMTPEYASPEQVRGAHITTATDIYSLGVVLYELLTGASPYKLKDASPEELSRAICHAEPAKPSQAIYDFVPWPPDSKADSPSPQLATQNPKLLKGDLDNIVLMALRKEPERRYKSVEQLSEDVGRHMEGLPVIARKDTFTYRASKFVGRNRVAFAAACLVFLTLVGGIVATIWQAKRAREQARIAEAKSAETQAALARTEKINRFMQSVFSYANPDWFGRAGGRRDVSVLEAMRDLEKHIETDFGGDPDLQADVRQQMGDSYRTQGLFEDAERNLREALRIRLELYGEDNAKVAESMYILSGVRFQRGDLAENERLLSKALSIQRRHPNEGNDLPYMMVDYASFLANFKEDYAGALALDREALEEFRRRYGDDHYMIGETKDAIATFYCYLGDYDRAEAVVREYSKRRQRMSVSMLEAKSVIHIVRGEYREAEETIRQLGAEEQRLGSGPAGLAAAQDLQSLMFYRRGDYAQARAYAEKALATYSQGITHGDRTGNLARMLNKLGEEKRAETLLREAIESEKGSERVFSLAVLKSLLGESLTIERRFAEAEALLVEAYETQKSRVLSQNYELSETRHRLACLYRAWGRPRDAEKYLDHD